MKTVKQIRKTRRFVDALDPVDIKVMQEMAKEEKYRYGLGIAKDMGFNPDLINKDCLDNYIF